MLYPLSYEGGIAWVSAWSPHHRDRRDYRRRPDDLGVAGCRKLPTDRQGISNWPWCTASVTTPVRSDRPRAPRLLVVPVTCVAAAALALSGCSSTNAVSAGGESSTTAANNTQGGAPNGQGRGGTFGTIASIDGSNISINSTSFDGTSQLVAVTTSSDTKVTETKSGTVADIKVGDNVTVIGTANGTDVAAQQITDTGTEAGGGFPGGGAPGGAGGGVPGGGNRPTGSFPGGPNGPNGPGGTFPGGGRPGGSIPNGAPNGGPPAGFAPTRGVVRAVNGTTLTVTPSDGGAAVTVTTSSSTTVSLRVPSSMAALAVGQTVQVQGQTGADGTVNATSINQGAGGLGGGGFGPGGPGGGGAPNAGGQPPVS